MRHSAHRPRHRRGGPHRVTRGRGRPDGRKGSRFKTSRVEQRRDSSGPNPEERLDGAAEEPSIGAVAGESSESEDEEKDGSNSYGKLLQSLNFQPHGIGPPRKKRRLLDGSGNAANGQETLGRHHESEAKHQLLPEDSNDQEEIDGSEPETEDAHVGGEVLRDDHENDDQIEGDPSDPFASHFASPDSNDVSNRLEAVKEKKWTSRSSTSPLGVKHYFSEPIEMPENPPSVRNIKGLNVKQKYIQRGEEVWNSLRASERDVAAPIFGYRDVLFGLRTVENASRLRDLVMLHALNHVLQTRSRVIKNNSKLAQSDPGDGPEHRDQGFTRPKVLVILPTKQACVRFINSLVKICEPEQQENKSRFTQGFCDVDEEPWIDKPPDFQELFGGNDDDMFRIGIKFTRKTVKFFSAFYQSDMIFASPLGLRAAIETGGSKDGKEINNNNNVDFLSSIEVVIMDHANALLMQNWLHVEFIFSQLNLLPKESHDCDFSRVRHWYLDGQAKYFRQSIVLTDFVTPEINSLYTSNMLNWSGKAKYTATYKGAMLDIPASALPIGVANITQTFIRLNSPTPSSDADLRFSTFTSTTLPSLLKHTITTTTSTKPKSSSASGTLIFTPHHHDFVRLRNHLSTSSSSSSSLSFGTISEYSSVPDVSRARSHFQTGRHSILLYSERAHHFRRYGIRGVGQVVFYGLPENPLFWGEVVGFLADGGGSGGAGAGGSAAAVRALFSRWDVLKLERIVGSERVGRMIGDATVDTFTFT